MEPPSPLPPPSQSASSSPLADFQRIGHNTFLWTPSSYHANPSPETPLILVFSWNGAALKHIAKYTSTYQALFPHARILLVTSTPATAAAAATSYATASPTAAATKSTPLPKHGKPAIATPSPFAYTF
ncbi:indole-diterpene biosynthesis protein PaxU [Stemphylium lycopersici]|uniref:Indole-diterpene biosynthesis protein PaxU n=1 Tax=Stemphylium lycopersici TaxID=183478 RepID=A0A364MXG6_STELY|nr:indole-diterpene biosynthesis protein PaxU [Stemphylium lycopersici]RAR06436.1 indole-diterpene biosynthesis protein PaxU [Stemphylium lycopersici]